MGEYKLPEDLSGLKSDPAAWVASRVISWVPIVEKLIARVDALKAQRDTEIRLRESSEQENDRLRAERVELKKMLADVICRKNKYNEECDRLEADNETLKATVEELKSVGTEVWTDDLIAEVDALKERVRLLREALEICWLADPCDLELSHWMRDVIKEATHNIQARALASMLGGK